MKRSFQTLEEAALKGFEPDRLESDKCRVFLNLDSSTFYLVGTLIRNFLHVKENLFGEDQQFTPMDDSEKNFKIHPDSKSSSATATSAVTQEFDPRLYRPIDVVLDLAVTNLLVHMLKNCRLGGRLIFSTFSSKLS